MAEIKLTDLISVKTLQEIQDGFADLTGMAALTTDADGVPVTKGSNFTDFCMDLTRKSSKGSLLCERCDREGAEKTNLTGKASTYECHAGLVDFAAPIMLNGNMIGSFIGGQVLTEAPDEEKFRGIAEELGIDPDKYIAALRKVKIVDKKQVDTAANFLCTIAGVLSQTAYEAYLAQQNSNGLTSLNKTLYAKVKSAEETVAITSKRINNLSQAFDNLDKIASASKSEAESTSDTLKQIQDIAMNTKILGFNASIEASRAKEAGKGFGVIAQEVRSLAETSKASADTIQSTMGKITDHTRDMNDEIKRTRGIITQCVEDLDHFGELLEEISKTSE